MSGFVNDHVQVTLPLSEWLMMLGWLRAKQDGQAEPTIDAIGKQVMEACR